MRYFLLFLFLIISHLGYTQEGVIDSVKSALEKHPENDSLRINLYLGMASLSTSSGQYGNAESYLFQALTTAKKIHHKKKLEEIYNKLSRLEKTRGKFESALTYFQLGRKYSDSIYTEDQARKMAEIEKHYETEKKGQLIQLLERDKQISSLWRKILIVALFFVTCLSLILYFLRNYREKKNRQILMLQIDSLTTQQIQLSEKYKSVLIKEDEISVVSQDQRLLKKAIEIVEQNLGDHLFGVEKMAKDMGMSRTNMHRKLKAITGFPPSELIRSMRLRKAALLIRNATDSISQISFIVGFEDHSYFSKAFKKQFGVSPSEYQSTQAIEVPQVSANNLFSHEV